MHTSDGLVGLDCVIIGPHEMEFETVRERMWTMGEQSAAYRVLKTNTTVYNGRRMPYFDMLNKMLEQATGSPSNLHVCHLPSLGVSHLKTFLHNQGLRASEVNFFTAEKARLIDLLAQAPNAVAITTTFYVDNDATTEIVKFVRESNPAATIIVGGPHVLNIYNNYDTAAQDFIFKTIGADIYICDSQGEHTLSTVLKELREKAPDFARVPNLVYTSDLQVFHRTPRMIENNPIAESVVDWSLFDTNFYAPTVQMRTARSCSFSCAFCQYPSLGGPLSLNSIEFIESQLRHFQEAGVENVVFIDDTFNVPLPRFKKICRMMIDNKFDLNWFSFFRCSNSDDEAFDLMARSGCKGVFLGIESGDNTILKNMHKSASAERYRNGIKKLTDRGIFTFASLIAGFPGETRETMNNTIDFIAETAPTFYRAELYYHYTSVPIHQDADKYGLVGTGYHWRHNTMGWEEASEMIEHMYKTIDSSIVVPGYMFDFWSIPYLLGKGMTLDHVMAFTRRAQESMVRNL
jgi:radical SAM PhpK family P-methyltransferase